MKTHVAFLLAGTCIGLSICSSGCAPKYKTNYHRSQFKAAAMEEVWVAQPVDGRWVARESDKFDKRAKKLHDVIVDRLKRKGCQVTTGAVSLGRLAPTEVALADETDIQAMGPADARWVLIPVIEDTKSQVCLCLFDKTEGRLVWEGTAAGTSVHAGAKYLLGRLHKIK